MTLKDLIIDRETIEEETIEQIVSPHVGYDPKQKSVILLGDKTSKLNIPQKITLYLLALKGWRFIEGGKDIPQEATPKVISEVIGENGSTVRNHLQALRREGVIYKTASGAYTILPQSIYKIKKILKISS